MRRLATLMLLAWCASVAACTLNWDPLQPSSCGAAGQPCCTEGGTACQSGLACASGTCPSPCPSAAVFCAGACVDVSSSTTNCGACGHACAAGQICNAGNCTTMCLAGQTICSGTCVDLMTSATSCGSCGNSCESTIPHAGATCSGGTCQFVACAAGFGDCDSNHANGCETNLMTSTSHCGTCANACPGGGANQVATCAAGACGVGCASGFGDCNGMAADGCETPTSSDPTHCGGCTNVCPTGANATAACASGTCSLTCATGFADCDRVSTTGCEVNLQTDNSHCGACTTRCTGMRTCTAGSCH